MLTAVLARREELGRFFLPAFFAITRIRFYQMLLSILRQEVALAPSSSKWPRGQNTFAFAAYGK